MYYKWAIALAFSAICIHVASANKNLNNKLTSIQNNKNLGTADKLKEIYNVVEKAYQAIDSTQSAATVGMETAGIASKAQRVVGEIYNNDKNPDENAQKMYEYLQYYTNFVRCYSLDFDRLKALTQALSNNESIDGFFGKQIMCLNLAAVALITDYTNTTITLSPVGAQKGFSLPTSYEWAAGDENVEVGRHMIFDADVNKDPVII